MGHMLVMPVVVDLEKFRPREKIPNTVAFVGRLTLEKNLFPLLTAMYRVKRWASLHVYGDGPLQKEYQKVQVKLGFLVWWYGSLSNDSIALALGEMEYLVVPSLYDQAPKVLLEGMACGCLVIASYPLHHMVEDGITGYLCDPTSVGIAEALRRARDDPNREQVRANALELVRSRHGSEKAMEAEREIIRCLK